MLSLWPNKFTYICLVAGAPRLQVHLTFHFHINLAGEPHSWNQNILVYRDNKKEFRRDRKYAVQPRKPQNN